MYAKAHQKRFQQKTGIVLSIVSSLLRHQQKKVVSNSFIERDFSYCSLITLVNFIRSYRKVNKLHERILQLCQNEYNLSYEKRFSKQDLVNIHLRNIHQLMIEIFKSLGLCPSCTIEIFISRNILYTISNPRDLNSHLPKTVYCRCDTTTSRGPKIWQLLPEEIKNAASQSSSSRTLSCGKTPDAHVEFAKRTSKDLDSYIKNHADSSCIFCSIMLVFLFFYLSIQGSTYNFLTLSLFRL